MSIELLIVILIAPLVLIESREALQGLLSMPVFTAFILIYIGLEPRFVLFTATIVQLYYHRKISSGAVLFPEYGYGFWVVAGIGGLMLVKNPHYTIPYSIAAFLIIIAVSKLSAFFLQFKRKLLEKAITKFAFLKNRSSSQLAFSLFLSYLIFLIPAVLLYFLILISTYFSVLP